jgi:Ca2+-binding RTX toxin-like protein
VSTILVDGDYVIDASQNLTFTPASGVPVYTLDGYAVFLSNFTPPPLSDPNFTDYGSINVSSVQASVRVEALGDNGGTFYFSSLIKIAEGGSLSVSATGAASSAYGYDSNIDWPAQLENDGTFAVSATLYATGAYLASGQNQQQQHPLFNNTGIYSVSGATATGVQSSNSGVYINSGTFSVTGTTTATGFGLGTLTQGSSIANSGTVIVTATSGASYGITLTGSDQTYNVVNTGTIIAQHAVYEFNNSVPSATPVLHLDNSGTINGDIILGDGPSIYSYPAGTFAGAQIHNTGAINGAIHLDANGNDLYDGRGGTQMGGIYLGGGTNTVYLGNDGETVHGGAGAAIVTGGTGADAVTGGSGNDLIDGGGGNDNLDGGAGSNTITFASVAAGVTVSLALQGQVQGTGAGSDTLSNFQNLTGSAFNDTLEGDGNNNVLDGGGGINTVSYASATSGVTASLALQGQAQATGGAGSDILSDFQNLTGSACNDTLEGDGNNNVLDGGAATNTVSYAHAAAGVTVSLGLQGQVQNTVGAGTDTLTHFQALVGSAFGDTLEGGGTASTLTGGLGADTFVYRAGDGNVTVTDFSDAQGDRIDISGYGAVHTLQDVLTSAVQSGADTVISLAGGGSITLHDIAESSLVASDFIFGRPVAGDFLGTGHGGLYWQNAVNNLTSVWTVGDDGATSGISLPAVPGWQTQDLGNFSGGPYGGDFLLRNTSTGMVNIWQDNAGVMSGQDVAQATLDWQIMGTADFNGDGKSDILWRNEVNGYVSVWQMDGAQVATTYNPGQVGLEWKIVGAGDFVGDGKAEVLWRNTASGEVDLWTIDGPGAGQTHGVKIADLPLNWKVAGSGDFNGDGRNDILWQDQVSGQMVVWEMNGAQVIANQAIGNPGPQWKVVALSDINGDGKADILWRDSGTGQVVTWEMNGFDVASFSVLATVDNTWQTINHHYDWA